ncbi:MAG: RNA polymerase sigma factor [Bacteroidales bacterium]
MDNTRDKDFDEIIEGCLKKKSRSQELLYKRYFGYAFKIALIHNRDRDNALEIVNDSFMKVFSQITRYDRALPFGTWLGRIVINTSIDRFRKYNKDFTVDEGETLLIPDTAHGVVNELTARDIMTLLDHLPEIQKLVFSLYEIDGYSHEEIAGLLNIPENTSRVYLTRAKKRLRELFDLFFNASYEKFGN